MFCSVQFCSVQFSLFHFTSVLFSAFEFSSVQFSSFQFSCIGKLHNKRNRSGKTCNIKIENNYLEDRTVCRTCYYKKKRKTNNKNTLIQNQQPKVDNVNTDNLNLSMRFSNSGKRYLVNYILLQKQTILIIEKP